MEPERFEQWARGRHAGKTALIVGGGPSGARWRELYSPDKVLITVNGCIPYLADVLDYAFCIDPPAPDKMSLYPWIKTPLRDGAFKLVHPNIICFHGCKPAPNVIEVMRSWHTAGFDPKRYLNTTPIRDRRLYEKYRTGEGIWRDNLEFGLLKGPVTDGTVMKFSVGTCLLQLLHLCCMFDVAEVETIGFDFCFGDKQHWYDGPQYENKPLPEEQAIVAVDSEQFIHVNGRETLWIFAQSAAICAKMIDEVFDYDFTDYSGGLLSLDGIASILEHIGSKPKDCYV